MQKYSLEFTRKPKSLWAAASGYILENGIRIASFRRKGPRDGSINPIDWTFYSERARGRFSDFTGELSTEETIEALYPGECRR